MARPMGRTIMIQGTSSHVGKSVLCTALCRIFKQDGYTVAPFKSQNMSLNSYVTTDGGEISRAQAVQAEAAGIEPTVDMNPILLKPKKDTVSQVIVRGKPLRDMTADEYRADYIPVALDIVKESLARLRRQYEIVVIEGAGSPAEVNLKDRDIANMRIAEIADAPVLLVADINLGGVFASLIGTLDLLEPWERDRVAGLVINKFRGSKALFDPGIEFLEKRTGKPVFGVVPFIHDLQVAEEDSVSLEVPGGWSATDRDRRQSEIHIAVVKLPHISNFSDMDALASNPDVLVRYVDSCDGLKQADAVIIPGTKNTMDDLLWLHERGLTDILRGLASSGTLIVGLCGGYQMLGLRVVDSEEVESDRQDVQGLGLLPVTTVFERGKILSQVKARVLPTVGLFSPLTGRCVSGYEIHMGRTELLERARPLFALTERDGREVDIPEGAVGLGGRVFGTYIHGVFDSDPFRQLWLDYLRSRKGLTRGMPQVTLREMRQAALDRLASTVRANLDIERVYMTF